MKTRIQPEVARKLAVLSGAPADEFDEPAIKLAGPNKELAEVLARRAEAKRANDMESVADTIISLSEQAEQEREEVVQQLRELRMKENALRARLNVLREANEAVAQGNYVPLMLVVDPSTIQNQAVADAIAKAKPTQGAAKTVARKKTA